MVTATAAFSTPLRRLPAPHPHQATPRSASDVLASVPLSFEPAGDGRFLSSGPGYSLALSPAEAVVGVAGGSFGLRPAGPTANTAPLLTGGQSLPGTVNHLEGADAAAWTTGVPTFGSVVARQVWPGVDMVWHGNQRALEHDVVVGPGADPGVVALDVDSAGPVTLDAGGDLVVDLGGASARLSRPVVYQDVAGARRPVDGTFTLLGPSRVGFAVGAYDHDAPLVIDPTLVTSTTLGGAGSDVGYSIALDASGNTYVTGSTESTDFPTGTPFQPALAPAASGPSTDVFVSKLSPDGTTVLWSTYLGGKGRDTGYAIAVGPGGFVYVSGVTESPDFPRAKAAQDNYGGGPSDAFVARIAANGSALDWSTFLGGNQTDRARGLAVDAAGNAYVTGSTSSVDFPSVNAQQAGAARPDDVDAFVTKIPPAGAPLTYSTRLGGSNDDHGLAIAVDGQGEAYVTGDTLSAGFPTVRPLQATSGGSASGVAGSFPDAFVAKFTAAGSALAYSTFLGGSDYDQGTGIAVDGSGAAYVTGSTNSPNFPTVSPIQARKDNDADAFVAKVDPTGAALAYSTYLGGGGADGGNGIAVDAAGDAFVTGTTGSTNWPTTKPTQATKAGGDDGFTAKLNPSGNGLLFSTYLGGHDSDSGMSVAVDPKGAVHVLGLTSSSDFPQVKPLQGSHGPAGGDAFVVDLSLSDAVTAAPTATTPAASADTGHSRRVRALAGLTVALLLLAGLQTLYLRRRSPRPGPAPGPKPKPQPQPQARPAGKAGAGLRVLDDAGIGAGPAKVGATAAAGASAGGTSTAARAGGPAKSGGAGSKPARTPKTRGGPKGVTPPSKGPNRANAGAPKAGGANGGTGPARQGAGVKAPVPPAPVPVASGESPADADGGEPTMATPAAVAPKPRLQAPAVAQLLEEEMWEPEPQPQPVLDPSASVIDTIPPAPAPAAPTPAAPAPPPPAAQEPPPPPLPPSEPAPVMAGAPVGPPPAIPPLPADELSFWDLFPEDLPPARPVAYPTEDLLADHLALPDGPDSIAARLGADAPPQPAPRGEPAQAARPTEAAWVDLDSPVAFPAPIPPAPPAAPPRPPSPPEAEIVIAELLDGPAPTGLQPAGDSVWAPHPSDDDFLIDDLLTEPATGRPADPPVGARPPAGAPGPEAAPAGRPGPDEQSRIAADQARRRRTRRGGGGGGGRRGRPGGG